jgi:catechol 2,3-dioxygenase-like lactoylglutathione lyase family enzyme
MDWKLELVAIPVSDVDRAKAFYTEKLGFNADHDHRVTEELRFVQLTPPGSACSIALGTGITEAPAGSVKGVQLVVSDVRAARAELVERGVEVSEVQEFPWGSFVFFSDPGWKSLVRARGACGGLGEPVLLRTSKLVHSQ